MGAENLVFKESSEVIYDPAKVYSGVAKSITIINMGTGDLTDLGVYMKVASNLGDVDYPSDNPPDTDYQDLMSWGEDVERGVEAQGGVQLTLNQNSGVFSGYITRSVGNSLANKIPLIDIAAGVTETIVFTLETPPSETARRLYIDLVIE